MFDIILIYEISLALNRCFRGQNKHCNNSPRQELIIAVIAEYVASFAQ